MVEYARKLKPRAILIENVKALQSAPNLAGKRGGVVQDLTQELESIGYTVSSKVINPADFGVAQLRQRLFIVALRGARSEERRVGTGCVGTCRSRWWPLH